MAKRISIEEKTGLLDSYITKPRGMHDVPVLLAIKADVVKANTSNVKKASEAVDNWLYNQAMGEYRKFLAQRGSRLDMKGRKASINSKAMRDILEYIRKFAEGNGKDHHDEAVLEGIKYIFGHWERLNDFHRNRIMLPDIYAKIEEILPQIKNGSNKKQQANSAIEQRKLELAAKRQ